MGMGGAVEGQIRTKYKLDVAACTCNILRTWGQDHKFKVILCYKEFMSSLSYIPQNNK